MESPPERALKSLHVTESARGGVGTYLNQTLPEFSGLLAASGMSCDMRVIIPEEHRFMLTRVDDEAISTYRRGTRGVLPLLRLAAATWREIHSFRPHIVHLHSSFAGLVVRPMLLASRLFYRSPRAVIYSPHGWAFQITGAAWRQRLIVAVERVLAVITNRIIVLSNAERRECVELGFPVEKLVRIYNGIRRDATPAVPTEWRDSRLKVFFVGRFDRQKGLDTLMAAARLATDRVCVRCAGASVVGDEAAQQATPANVELLGWMDEGQIEGQFELADIVAVPSRWEGFGLVAVEAMRAGLPVVASCVGGLPEVVEDGVTGRLVPPDDPASLLAALLADDADARRRMGAAGQARFRARFTATHSAEAMGEVYRDVATTLGLLAVSPN